MIEKQNILRSYYCFECGDDLLLSVQKSIKDIMNKNLQVQLIIFYRIQKVYLFVGHLVCGKSTLAGF